MDGLHSVELNLALVNKKIEDAFETSTVPDKVSIVSTNIVTSRFIDFNKLLTEETIFGGSKQDTTERIHN